KNPAAVLASPVEMVWFFNIWPVPGYDPKPTSNVTVMLFVNVESRMLMAVCSSWRKLLICAWVNGPSVVKSLLTWICMRSSRSLKGKKGDSPQAATSVACTEFLGQSLLEFHFLDNQKAGRAICELMNRRQHSRCCGT